MEQKNQFTKVKIIAAASLIIFGAISRYLLKDLPNVETITAVSLLAGSLLGGVWTLVVGLVTVALSDIFIGNSSILLYTWSAWAVMGVFGWLLCKRKKRAFWHSLELTGMGFLGNMFFYLWTNFGVWQEGWLYPGNFQGLLASYVAGLPFLKMQLIGTAVIVPLVSLVAILAWKYLPVRKNFKVFSVTQRIK